MANISDLLTQLGFTTKEVQVFLSLSKIGASTVSAVARETKITRTHIYNIATELMERGLLVTSEKSGIRQYEAIDHTALMAHISHKQRQLQKLEKKFAQVASEFNALRTGEAPKTKVRFYDGVEGIVNVYEEVRNDLKTANTKELLTIWPVEALEKTYPFFYDNKINVDMPGLIKRDIMCESPMAALYIQRYAQSPTEHHYKIWPKEKGVFPTDALCWENKVAYTDVQGFPSSIVIENKAVAETFRMYFWQMWNSLG